MVQEIVRRIDCAGQSLVSTWFAPQGEPRGLVLLVPAMAVRQSYYAAFARWVAATGSLAVSFDYRGVGASRSGSLRQLDVDVLGWARDDCSAVIDAIRAEYPHHPLVWVGHSLGGQILPFVRSPERVDRAVFVATGSGYWRNAPVSVRPRVWFLCHLLGPLLSETMGYFPARLLGALDDLPSGVVRQWCAWCRDPAYSTGSERAPLYRGLTLPITSISFRDDEFMSERNTADFLGAYASARLRHRWVEAAEFGLPRLGHFGFFRAQPDLWQALLAGELP